MKTIFSLFLLLCTLLYSQTDDFSLIVKQPFDAALFDITEDYDRTLSAVGFSKEFKQKKQNEGEVYTNAFDYLESVSNQYGSQMHLIQVGESANIILSKAAKLSKFNEAIAVVKTPRNGYIVGGHTLGGELLITKLDSNGQIIYSRMFGTSNHDKMKDLVLLGDGGVLVVGTSMTSRSYKDDVFEGGLGNNDIFVAKFSKFGEHLWSKKYGTPYDDEGISGVEAFDGSFLIVAKTSSQTQNDITLLRLSENGDKIWIQSKASKASTQPTKIIKLKENNFLISIIEDTHLSKEHIRLLKFDIQGKTIADKEIFTRYPSALYDIKEFSNGTLIGVGYTRDGHNQDALAMQISSRLLMLNQEHYGSENYDVFYGAHILHNSQVAVAGVHTDKNSQESNMWVVKLNANGTMAKIATKSGVTMGSGDFYAQLLALFKEEIAKKQLAIHPDLSIEFLDPSLYFNVGSYKLSHLQKTFLKKFADKLFTFLMRHASAVKTLEVNGHTSSEWGNADFTHTYLNNAKLSMERSFSTMSYVFNTQPQATQKWLSQILKESGFSYAKKVMRNEVEDKEKSRRVNFKIILK